MLVSQKESLFVFAFRHLSQFAYSTPIKITKWRYNTEIIPRSAHVSGTTLSSIIIISSIQGIQHCYYVPVKLYNFIYDVKAKHEMHAYEYYECFADFNEMYYHQDNMYSIICSLKNHIVHVFAKDVHLICNGALRKILIQYCVCFS